MDPLQEGELDAHGLQLGQFTLTTVTGDYDRRWDLL